jgi:regulatory protein
VNKGSNGTLHTDERLERAFQIAFPYLNQRERTESEVRHRLASEGIAGPALEQAIAGLIEQGLIDDARYARLFTEDKRELEGWGSDRIRRTLLERGVERDAIERALGEGDGDRGTELERALALLRRRFPRPPRERRERDRALGVLLRKGYDSELAVEALGAYALHAEDPELR